MKNKVTCIIPARIGSRRLKGKNFLDFCGRPLAEWAILCAIKCKLIDKIIFSTDKEDYIFDHPKVIIDRRDKEMCKYDLHTDDIYLYLKKKYNIEGSMIVLEPTSPIRTPEILEEGIEMHLANNSGERIYDDEVIPIITDPETGMDIDYWYQFRIAEYLFTHYKIYYNKGLTIKEILES
jgi:CMP-N-acetylneuraminic acid synthetase